MTESGTPVATGADARSPRAHRDAGPACGRFAPTPNGPLHLGSLSTAVGSWLRIRHRSGLWRLRLDDLDTARCPPGMADRILDQLRDYGLYWDGDPVYQSQHRSAYAEALAQLEQQGRVYPCNCSRAALRARRVDAAGYDRHCLRRPPSADEGPFALRLRMPAEIEPFEDALLGPVHPEAGAKGDPVLRRRDGIIGYALACAVDESLMGITEVFRGADLVQESFAQREILRQLSRPLPRYGHLPLVTDRQGRKLSKQNHAAPVPDRPAARTQALLAVLGGFGYELGAAPAEAGAGDLLRWAARQPLPAALR
jgi:glutamyl-Q tRNA(Asp) synthetase